MKFNLGKKIYFNLDHIKGSSISKEDIVWIRKHVLVCLYVFALISEI